MGAKCRGGLQEQAKAGNPELSLGYLEYWQPLRAPAAESNLARGHILLGSPFPAPG